LQTIIVNTLFKPLPALPLVRILCYIAVVRKTFRFRDAFIATAAYAAILFAERNDDRRYKSEKQAHAISHLHPVETNGDVGWQKSTSK
jgi:hypothetical protein